jgi:hypothetical protein
MLNTITPNRISAIVGVVPRHTHPVGRDDPVELAFGLEVSLIKGQLHSEDQTIGIFEQAKSAMSNAKVIQQIAEKSITQVGP